MGHTHAPGRPAVGRISVLSAAIAVTIGLVLSMLAPLTPARAATGDEAGAAAVSPGAEILYLTDADLAAELDLYVANGAKWIRIDVDWAIIEQTQGVFSWTRIDRVVAAAEQRGLKVLGIATYAPKWANGGNTSHYPPLNASDFATFVSKVVLRYGTRIPALEIWNEPNIPNFWSPSTNAPAYTELLKAAYLASKAANPAVTILAGALSPATDTTTSLSPVSFTTQMYANGAKGHFDALSVHPYSFPALPSDPTTSSWNTFYRVPLLRDIMVTNGDSAKKIWLTEFGAPTGTGTQAVTEQRQADIIADGYRLAKTWTYAGPLFTYSGRDRGTDPLNREHNFGMVFRDFSPKIALGTFKSAAGVVVSSPTPTVTPTASPTPTVTATPTASPTPTVTATGAIPAAPKNLLVGSIASKGATVSWSVPAGTSPAVADYVLQLSRDGVNWSTWTHTPTAATQVALTGLRTSTTYSVRVALINSLGRGASATATFKTLSRTQVAAASLSAATSRTVVRTKLAKSASKIAWLRKGSAYLVVDPAGASPARRVAKVTMSRSGVMSTSVPARWEGRAWFVYKAKSSSKWSRTAAQTI